MFDIWHNNEILIMTLLYSLLSSCNVTDIRHSSLKVFLFRFLPGLLFFFFYDLFENDNLKIISLAKQSLDHL